MNIFEKASRLQLRFNTSKGNLSVEDLWSLPLVRHEPNLDNLALELDSQLQKQNKSFVKEVSTLNYVTQLKFDIIKHIIDTKLKEAEETTLAANKAAKRQQIIDLIAQKQNEEVSAKSVEELTKMLAEL